MNKCPYCNKKDFIPGVVFRNIESYGPKVVHFNCERCNKIIQAYGEAVVHFTNIKKTTKGSDW